MRLPLSAIAAAAGLYAAIIAFGPGPTSPRVLGPSGERGASVVRVPHDPAVSGPVQRGPQPSPGPARPRPGVVARAKPVRSARGSFESHLVDPARPAAAPSAPPPASSSPAPSPLVPPPTSAVPELPTPSLPAVPELPQPTLPVIALTG